MSFRSDFRCPHCNGALAVSPLTSNGPGALQPGPDPQAGELVRNAQVQPAGEVWRQAAARMDGRRKKATQATGEAQERSARARVAKKCPVHHRAAPSRFGGLYCPTPDPSSDNGWCSWRPAGKESAA